MDTPPVAPEEPSTATPSSQPKSQGGTRPNSSAASSGRPTRSNASSRPASSPRRAAADGTSTRAQHHKLLHGNTAALAPDEAPMLMFIELVREKDGKQVQLYMRRKHVPSDLDGGTAFFCLSHHELSDGPDSLYGRTSTCARTLKGLAVSADTFHHTGRVFCGFAPVKKGIARARLSSIPPNTYYRIAVVFKLTGQDTKKTFEDPVPLLDTVQLRELKDRPNTKIVTLTRLMGSSPWSRNLIPSNLSLRIVAQLYVQFASRLTHRKRFPLTTPMIFRGVADPLCSQYISLAMKCGDIFRMMGGARDEVPPSRLFDAISELGKVPQTKSVQLGPLVLDWYDFLILSSYETCLFPRLQQLISQYYVTEIEGMTLRGKVRAMISPDLKDLPPGTLLKLLVEEQALAPKVDFLSMSVNIQDHHIQQNVPLTSVGRNRKQQTSIRNLLSAVRKKSEGNLFSDIDGETDDEEMHRRHVTLSDRSKKPPALTAARAIWSVCPLRQQIRVATYAIPWFMSDRMEEACQAAARDVRESINWKVILTNNDKRHLAARFETWSLWKVRKVEGRFAAMARRQRSMLLTKQLLDRQLGNQRSLLKTRLHAWILFVKTRWVFSLLTNIKNSHLAAAYLRWVEWSKPQYRVRLVMMDVPPMPMTKIIRIQVSDGADCIYWKTGRLGGTIPLPGHRQPQLTATAARGRSHTPSSSSFLSPTPRHSQVKSTTPSPSPSKKGRAGKAVGTPAEEGKVKKQPPRPLSAVSLIMHHQQKARLFRTSIQQRRTITYTLLQVSHFRQMCRCFLRWLTWLRIKKETRAQQERTERVLYTFVAQLTNGVRRHYFDMWKKRTVHPSFECSLTSSFAASITSRISPKSCSPRSASAFPSPANSTQLPSPSSPHNYNNSRSLYPTHTPLARAVSPHSCSEPSPTNTKDSLSADGSSELPSPSAPPPQQVEPQTTEEGASEGSTTDTSPPDPKLVEEESAAAVREEEEEDDVADAPQPHQTEGDTVAISLSDLASKLQDLWKKVRELGEVGSPSDDELLDLADARAELDATKEVTVQRLSRRGETPLAPLDDEQQQVVLQFVCDLFFDSDVPSWNVELLTEVIGAMCTPTLDLGSQLIAKIVDGGLLSTAASDGSMGYVRLLLNDGLPSQQLRAELVRGLDVVDFISSCLLSHTCRVPLTKIVLQSLLAQEEGGLIQSIATASDDLLPLWQEFFEDVTSPKKKIPKEDRSGEDDLIALLLSSTLMAAMPINFGAEASDGLHILFRLGYQADVSLDTLAAVIATAPTEQLTATCNDGMNLLHGIAMGKAATKLETTLSALTARGITAGSEVMAQLVTQQDVSGGKTPCEWAVELGWTEESIAPIKP